MISAVLIVVGVMLLSSGLGLRALQRAFGTTLAVIGGMVILDGAAGFFVPGLSFRTQLWCAVGIVGAFSVAATVWVVVAGITPPTPKK